MAWVKLDDGFPDHRKLAEMGAYAPLCGWLYVCGLAYCNRQLTDGLIPKVHIPRLAGFDYLSIETGESEVGLGSGETIDVKDVAALLVQADLWEDAGPHYLVHDYLVYQPSRESVLRERAKVLERQKRWKERQDRAHPLAVPNAAFNAVANAIDNGVMNDVPTVKIATDAIHAVTNAVNNTPPVPDPDKNVQRESPPRVRASAPLIESPLAWDRKHGGHVGGFCDWVCLPSDLVEQFATRATQDSEAVIAWATAVRANWKAHNRVPAERMYDFWNARWADQHGTGKAPPAPPVKALPPNYGTPGESYIQRTQREREAREKESA